MNPRGAVNISELIPPSGGSPPVAVQFMSLLGMVGLGSPVARAIFGFLVGSGLTYIFQPQAAFDEMGARPLYFLTDQKDRGTYFPWYLPGVMLGFIFSVLI